MTAEGEFIDSLGNRIQGTETALRMGGLFQDGPRLPHLSFGNLCRWKHSSRVWSAQGTFSKDGQLRKEDVWKTPAAWRAVIKDGKIAVWQVYADKSLSGRS